jgi:hypothetical protein
MHTSQENRVAFARALRGATLSFVLFSLAACGGGDGDTPAATTTAAPTITSQPSSASVVAPATATFSVTAAGSPAPTYQWNAAGVAIPGATSATYTTPASTLAMNGAAYTVTVTNPSGVVTSTPATLTVAAAGVAAPALSWDGVNHTTNGFNYTQGTYLIGFEFKATRAITVSQLGAYDSAIGSMPNGAQTFQATPVGLYNLTTHTLLGSVTVSASDPVTTVFRFVTLATPVALNTTDTYAVVWASGTNHYVATQGSAIMVPADVNAAIQYLGFAGYGAGGLTQTGVLVEPNFFFPGALNYDIGPNFILR